METESIGLKLLMKLLKPVKEALLDKDIEAALKLLELIEAMGIAAIDFEETNKLNETYYDAKAALADELAKEHGK